MSDYSQVTLFTPKDALTTGNPAKKIRGAEFDPEFSAISTAIASKFDSNDIADNATAVALTSDVTLITPAKLSYVLQNATIVLGANVQLNGGIAASDVARKGTANTFTAIQTLSSAEPIVVFTETDGGTNTKNWILRASGNTFNIASATDAAPNVPVNNAIVVTRSGSTTISNVNLLGTTVQANGSAIWTAGNDGTGSGLDADLLDGLNSSTSATASTIVARDASGNIAAANFTGGTYTPSVPQVVNCTLSTAFESMYSRIGNIVTVSGVISISVTSGSSVLTSVYITLPVASNFTQPYHARGSGGTDVSNGSPIFVTADTTNDRAIVQFYSTTSGAQTVNYIFQYQVL